MRCLRNIWIPMAALFALLGACSTSGPVRTKVSLPGTKITFEGAEKYSSGELVELIRRELNRYSERPRRTVLDDAAFRIENLYRFQGYARVRVSVRYSPEEIHFRIEEGPRFTLGRVHFHGNRVIRTKSLKNLVPKGFFGASPAFSPRLLALLMDQVNVLYRARGYLDIRIRKPRFAHDEEEEEISVHFEIVEGHQFLLARLEGLPSSPPEVSSLARFVGKPYASGTPEAIEATMIDHYRDNGYPSVRVQSRINVDKKTAQVTIKLELDKGAPARTGALLLKGNHRTSRSYIRKRIDIDRGEEFRSSKLFEGEQRLRETGLFRSVQISPGTKRDEHGFLPLKVELEENLSGEVSARAGYGTLRGPRGGLEVSYRNLFGQGELGELGVEMSGIGYRGSAEFAMPFFLGSNLEPSLSAFLEEQEYSNFDAIAQGGVFSMEYPLLRRITAKAGIRHSVIQTEDVDENVDPGDLLDFDFTALSLSASWDRRNSAALPSRGGIIRAEIEWSPEELGSKIQFVRINGRGTYFVSLPWNMVLATSLQGGLIRPVQETDVIPISLRYFAGGTNTVRGFEARDLGSPSGGEVYLALQIELRFPIWAGFHGALFHDRGGVWFDHRDIDLDETRWSVGGGLRYYTPAGPIAADVGWNPDRKSGEDSVEFHFSIGFPF